MIILSIAREIPEFNCIFQNDNMLNNVEYLPTVDIVTWLLSNHFCQPCASCAVVVQFTVLFSYSVFISVLFVRNASVWFILNSVEELGSKFELLIKCEPFVFQCGP